MRRFKYMLWLLVAVFCLMPCGVSAAETQKDLKIQEVFQRYGKKRNVIDSVVVVIHIDDIPLTVNAGLGSPFPDGFPDSAVNIIATILEWFAGCADAK